MSSKSNSMKPVGAGLVCLGLVLAAGQYFDFQLLSGRNSWPYFIIVPGALLLALAFLDETFSKALMPIGMVVTLTGCVLAYQNWANHFESWAYAWIIVGPFALGVGLAAHGRLYKDAHTMKRGMQMAAVNSLFFLCAAVIFELVFNISGYGLSFDLPWGILTPIALIAVGGALFLNNPKAR